VYLLKSGAATLAFDNKSVLEQGALSSVKSVIVDNFPLLSLRVLKLGFLNFLKVHPGLRGPLVNKFKT